MPSAELSRTRSRVLAVGVGLLLASLAGLALYLPFKSSFAAKGAEERRRLASERHEGTAGGVWSNINKAAKASKKDRTEEEE